MPKKVKELTALAIKRLEHSGKKTTNERHAVGGVSGLMIQITPNHSKSWILRTTIANERCVRGLGPYPEMSLAEARTEASKYKQQIKEGIDPRAEKKKAQAAMARENLRQTSFAQVTEEYIDTQLGDKGVKSQKQWKNTLRTYAVPVVGNLFVDDIDIHHVLRILQPIWESKTETARKLQGRIEKVLAFAITKGYRLSQDNPARWNGNLSVVLASPKKTHKTNNMPAVAGGDMPRWLKALRKSSSMSAKALEFIALTATRSGEVRNAAWSEVDLNKRIWTIPAERMKTGNEHRIPLNNRAVEILENLPRFQGSEYVFPAPRGGALTDAAIGKQMRTIHERDIKHNGKGFLDKKLNERAVPHGLRSTFRDWAADHTNHPRELVELCLAHNIASSVERAYRRSDVLEKRRIIMDEWLEHIEGVK